MFKALDTGSPGALVAVITADVGRGIRQRFESVERRRPRARATSFTSSVKAHAAQGVM